MSLAQRVRDYRYSKGWGPDELANRAEISRTALYQIESGKTELPRAGTLRRIALALDVSMETLLGNSEESTMNLSGNGLGSAQPAGGPNVASKPRGVSEWYPSEGAPLLHAQRGASKFDQGNGSRFGVEYPSGNHGQVDAASLLRERELVLKFHDIRASPLGEPVARIVEETYRLLPQARVTAPYE